MQQLFERRYKTRFYKLEFGKSVVRTFTPEKLFGTVLVGIGFASYLVPLLRAEVAVTPSHKDKSHVKYPTMRAVLPEYPRGAPPFRTSRKADTLQQLLETRVVP
jgi:hypothetical protein